MDVLREQLMRHEGLRLSVYDDGWGNPTIGWGHNLKEPITEEVAEKLLDSDIAKAITDCYKLPRSLRNKLNVARTRVVANMIFNMGIGRVMTFKKMIKAIEERNFNDAAAEMVSSRWAKQVGQRAVELAEIMRHG